MEIAVTETDGGIGTEVAVENIDLAEDGEINENND